MPYISVDVDLDDIVSGLNSREKQRLADDLYDDGYYQTKLERQIGSVDDNTISINEQFFRNNLLKIRNNYLNLSSEELKFIEKISKRF